MVEALLLDFYGTLVHEDDVVIAAICDRVASTAPPETRPDAISAAWSRAFRRECDQAFGLAFLTQRDAARRSLASVLNELSSPEDVDDLIRAQFEHWRRAPIFADTRAFLAHTGLPTCLVSNIDRSDLEAVLCFHELAFDRMVTSEDVRAYKPRPEVFRTALDLLGMTPAEALHVGDSWSSDVTGAHSLGVPVAWVNRTMRPRPAPLSLWAEVATLSDLTDLLATDQLRGQRR